MVSKNQDKNFVFMMNPTGKHASVTTSIKNMCTKKNESKTTEKKVSIPPKGSVLEGVHDIIDHTYSNHILQCNSSVPIKCYYIISDKKLESLSVDHI